jgi:hypothetical protein
MATTTYSIYNPTASAVTVDLQTVQAHSSATLLVSDTDAASFAAAGCALAEITPGVASPAQLQGFIKGE